MKHNNKSKDIFTWAKGLDLAVEANSFLRGDGNREIAGVAEKVLHRRGIVIHRITVLNTKGAERIGRPPGRYITLDIPAYGNDTDPADIAQTVAEELADLLPLPIREAPLLVLGLGNCNATPDALGPKVAELTCATRHLFAHRRNIRDIAPVCTIAPGVLGNSGIETAEIIRGVCHHISPAAVIAVDSLAAASVTRVGTTIQIAETGIRPGSGIDDRRCPINSDLTGCPVIAIGVPTMVDSAAIITETANALEAYRLRHQPQRQVYPDIAACRFAEEQLLNRFRGRLMVTPKDIDELIEKDAEIIAAAIAIAVHPAATKDNYLNFLC